MGVDAGAGRRADVDADVEAVGMERAFEALDGAGDQVVDLQRLLGGK